VAESQLAAAEADIQRAEDGLANTIIQSPMDGTITLLNVEVGEVVTGSTTNPGTVLMTVADLSRMILNAEVSESDIASVAVGQKAQVHINAYPDETFAGTVRQIALQRSVAPNGTGYFKVEVEIDLQGRRIYSGLIANVDIEIRTHDGIIVPYQSIVVRDVESLPDEARRSELVDHSRRKCNVVYRMVDGKSVCTPIRPGPSDLTHRLVLEGLAEDEDVIIGPYKVLESIKHDERVKVQQDPGEEAAAEEEEPEETEEDASGEATEPAAAETGEGNETSE
jgi:HlyD family secretion protein